jgi:TPR repeat protein
MKKILYIILSILCCTGYAFSQTETPEIKAALSDAYLYTIGFNRPYYPEKAFEIFKKYADEGIPKAMNGLGMLYRSGTGVETDYKEATKWFRKAAEAGYPQGWYNLGMMYKYAYGFDQDFDKAFKNFRKAADMDFVNGKYAAGYMLYKGLGCKQNYEEAFSLFKSASELGHPASMYMLGLCYRNGYGVEQTEETALHWLHRSDSSGYYLAAKELASDSPENNFQDVGNKLRKSREYKVSSPATFRKVDYNISGKDISGEYFGYVITYDWSGKHIIREDPLRLQIIIQDGELTGHWLQADSLSAKLQATLTDSSMIFTEAEYKYTDHYYAKPVLYRFKQASVNIINENNSLYLAGNLQLFSPETYEPERPVYISLSRESRATDARNQLDNIVDELVVFPNPFRNGINFRFNLKEASPVEIAVFTIKGEKVFDGSYDTLPAGEQQQYLPLSLSPGAYIFKVLHGDEAASTVIVRE